jgi:hypothetical protein
MPESKTFENVSATTWQRMKTLGEQKHGTRFEQVDDSSGQATTNTPFGRLVLAYAHNPEQNSITYTIISKPLMVMAPLVWSGIESTLEGCRQQS